MYYSGPGKWRKSFSKSGGGVLLQNGIHWINFIFSIFGYDYKLRSVECSYQDNVETESAISIRALVNRKTPCDMFMSRMNRSQPSLLKIYTQEETIELNESYFNKKKYFMTKVDTFSSKFSQNFLLRFTYPNLKHLGSLKDFLKDFLESNSGGKNESMLFDDACKDIEFVDAV